MKKLAALILACLLCATFALAEGQTAAPKWEEGLGPDQPYSHVPKVDLDETMGYIMLYPRTKLPASLFCDVLEIYLPREDLALGEGTLTLCNADGEVEKVSFSDAGRVELRPLEPVELEGLMWGGGMCLEVRLPVSLRFDESYYVLMDGGCFTAADGKLPSLEIRYMADKPPAEQAWSPLLTGDYGISNLFYSEAAAAPEQPTEEELEREEAPEEGKETPEPTATPEPEPAEPKLELPAAGDEVHFDLVLGGDAAVAVAYSENDSVYFENPEYAESGPVTGKVIGDELSWGVVFLNEAGEVLDFVTVG